MMTTLRPLPLLAVTVLLSACFAGPEQRFAVPTAPAGDHVAVAFGSIVVRDLSLPDYASSQEIFTRDAGGALTSNPKLLWADEPVRAMTLELSSYLSRITGARVAAEPWPFTTGPDAAIEVRVADMVADAGGALRLSGQYFVATEGGRNRGRLFDLTVPIGGAGTAADIAAARGLIVRDLARTIATEALR